MPKRIQRKRTKGWKMPPGVYVGRPGPYGNPYRISDYSPSPYLPSGERDDDPPPVSEWKASARRWAVDDFRCYAEDRLERDPDWLEPLRDQDLICWCALDVPCHGDVLLELANRDLGEPPDGFGEMRLDPDSPAAKWGEAFEARAKEDTRLG